MIDRKWCGVLLLFLVACNDPDGTGKYGGSIDDPDDQPAIVLVETDDTLGVSLDAIQATQDGRAEEDPARVVDAVAGLDAVCVRQQSGEVYCWSDVQPEGRDDEVYRGHVVLFPPVPTRILSPERLKSLVHVRRYTQQNGQVLMTNGFCGLSEQLLWYCWGDHPDVHLGSNEPRTTAKHVQNPIGPGMPQTVVPDAYRSMVRSDAGDADFSVDESAPWSSMRYCGVTHADELICFPGYFEDEEAWVGPQIPAGSKLSGHCYLTPDGKVGCGLPDVQTASCSLELTTIQARDHRGCGQMKNGEWRCFGRPAWLPKIDMLGFQDLTQAACP